ncbi:MAG: CRISPR-associated helicase Cas3', partial [Candidatus Thiodiazotropha taylori]|nr:CRISPR-associated helicase Cas3' [Candidatus Thiodiazotropha taylori]
WLFDTDMGEEGRPGGAWFNQSKRGLLAPFAVGTIDQALMAVMNVKHGFVRAFGLAGKVVILDEVHTYDAYTSTLLEALIDLLRQLSCTVIILSATLNQERRKHLLARAAMSMDYPLITASPGIDDEVLTEISVPVGENKQYLLSLCSDDAQAVEQALLRAEHGQQVLWIENTVKEAQQRYLDLAARAAELGVACGLLHSRFTVNDRQRIEEKWVNIFGKGEENWAKRQVQGRILVGTQVLEQSLDIDADFMVSRFAPTDMLLQRLGRLWRHDKTPRSAKARREAWLLAPDLETAIEEPINSFGSSAVVYNPYLMCRSLEVWQGLRSISLPGDIRDLIERTYISREEQGVMGRWLHELDHGNRYNKGKVAMRQLARVGLAEGGMTLPESKAQTRYTEQDNYEVLMLRRIIPGREAATLTLLNGEKVELPFQRSKLKRSEWRRRTAILMRQIVKVPSGEKPNSVSVDALERYGLNHCFFLGSQDWLDDESILRVALVDDTDRLRGIENSEIHDKHTLEYREDLGYRTFNNKE